MGWDAALSSRGLRAKLSTSQPQRRSMGDALPIPDMETERAFLPPVFENHSLLATAAPLTVHVEIQFTDPVIKSRYCRSYGSSPTFEPTPRICRGLMRRIERCSEELITRKDCGALDMFKEESRERKSLRYEMTFRIIRRGKGEWAEMTFRSYQKQALTVDLTKDIMLATHRMIGLFLRRHDQNFLWLDFPASDMDHEETQTTKPEDPPSLLCVPSSRFNEATQTFDFLPGYKIEVSFRSRNPQRKAPLIRKSLKVNSTQAAPLALFMSEDLLWKGSQAINYELDARKKEFDDHLSPRSGTHHSCDGALEIDLRISNSLGPANTHVHRNIQSRIVLFRHPEGRDCDEFLRRVEISLSGFRDHTDAKINSLDDLEFNICEVKGVGWKSRQPLRFSLGSSSSYGRRTIQAALDRIQTGIADVIRGRELTVHLTAHKRGHLVLDKAIIAHEKRGQPKEWFPSPDEEQQTFVTRLNSRIQADINMIFEDSCSIDDLPDEEEEDNTRPPTPVFSQRAPSAPSEGSSASSFKSPSKLTRSLSSRLQGSPKRFVQRVFSLGKKTSEVFKSKKSGDSLKTAKSSESIKSVSDSIFGKSETGSKKGSKYGSLVEERSPPVVADEPKPARRSFSLMSRRSIRHRVSNASTLVEEEDEDAHESQDGRVNEVKPRESQEIRAQTVGKEMTSGSAEKTAPRLLPHPAQNDDRASFSAHEARRSKMDTPGAYEDAREYILSPAGPTRGNSPSRFDEYSTAPSTPGLSSGSLDSSPRNSLMITPAYLETSSGTREPVLQEHCDPECDCQQPGMNDGAEIVVGAPEPKGGFATEQISVAQPDSSSPTKKLQEQTWKLDEEPRGPIDAADQSVAQTSRSGPGADLVEPTPPPTPTPTPDTTLSSDTKIAPPSVDQVHIQKLGAETSPDADHLSPVPAHPDFPTHQVRNASPSQELDLHVSDAETKVASAREDVGTATGAEVDNVGKDSPLSETGPSPDVTGVTDPNSSEEAGPDEETSNTVVSHGPKLANGDSETSDAVDVGSAKETEDSSETVDEPTERQAEEAFDASSDAEVHEKVHSVAESHPIIEFDVVTALNASEPESLSLPATFEVAEVVDGSEAETDDVVDEAAADQELVTEEQATVPVEQVTEEKHAEAPVTDGLVMVPEEKAAPADDQTAGPEKEITAAEEEALVPEAIEDVEVITESVGDDVAADQVIASEGQATASAEDITETQQEVSAPEEQRVDAQDETAVPEEVEAPEEQFTVLETHVTGAEKEATVPEEDATATVEEVTAPEVVADFITVAEDPATEEHLAPPGEVPLPEQAPAPETDITIAEEDATVPEENVTATVQEVMAPEVVANSFAAGEQEVLAPETDITVAEEDATVLGEEVTATKEDGSVPETAADPMVAVVDIAPEEEKVPALEEVLTSETGSTSVEEEVKATVEDATALENFADSVPPEQELASEERLTAPEEQEVALLEAPTAPEPDGTAANEEATPSDDQTPAPEAVYEQPAEEAPRDEPTQLETEEEMSRSTEADTVDHVEVTVPQAVVEDQLEVVETVTAPTEAEVVEGGEAVVPEAAVEHDLASVEPAAAPEAADEESVEEPSRDELDAIPTRQEGKIVNELEFAVPEAEAETRVRTESEIPKSIEIVVPEVVVEKQLASELEVQAEDDVKVVSPPEFALNGTADVHKDAGVTAVGVNENSFDIAEKELARELEVQANSSTEDEAKEETQHESAPQTDEGSAQLAPEVIISQIVGAAISKNEIPTITEDEVKEAAPSNEDESKQQAPEIIISQILGAAISGNTPITEDDGRKAEMAEQQAVIKQTVVAPTISVKDFTHQLPEDVSTGEVTAVSKESQTATTTEGTQQGEEEAKEEMMCKPDHPQPQSQPPVAIPDVAFLHPNRASASTLSSTWSYSETASLLSRGSVDTYRPSIDERREQEDEEEEAEEDHHHHYFPSCPQTAGFLGLQRDSPRFVCEVGLRGALGDVAHLRRRKSLPFNSSPLSSDSASVKSVGKRRRAKSALIKDEAAAAEGEGGDAVVIPKMMLLFAGAVALGKMIRGG